jgi:peptidoglycan hydrolase CwlO-like protein
MKRAAVILGLVTAIGVFPAGLGAQGKTKPAGKTGGTSGQTTTSNPPSAGNREEAKRLHEQLQQLQRELKDHEHLLKDARKAKDHQAAELQQREIKRIQEEIKRVEQKIHELSHGR